MDYKSIVSKVVESVSFDKVSDLTKDQFIDILSRSISDSINAPTTKDPITEAVLDQLRRESRT